MKDNKSKTAGLFLAGAVVGAAAALFMAPFSGRKMRRITKEKGKQAMDKAKEFEENTVVPKANMLKNEAQTKAKSFWGKSKQVIDETAEEAKDKVNKVTSRTKDKLDETSDSVEEVLDDVKS